MGKFKLSIAIGILAAASACAKLPDLSPDQWEAARTHVIKNIDKKRVFQAAEKVFRLADGNDFSFSYSSDGNTLNATQTYIFTIVISTTFGTNYWQVTLRQVGSDVHGRVNLSHYDKTPANPPIERRYENYGGAATYRVFWQRVEFVLGRSQKWPKCDEMKAASRASRSRLTQYTGWCAPWDKENKPERLTAK